MEIVDAHPHVIAADRTRYPFAPLGGTLAEWALRGLPCEGYLEALDAAGIARATLVQASLGYGLDNSYVADSAAAHPGRFTAVGAIDLGAPDAPDRMDYWARERGLTGFRIFLTAPNMGPDADAVLDDPRTFAVWERAKALGTPMKLQLRPPMLARAAGLLARIPDVDIIIDHAATISLADGPPYDGARALFDLARYPRANVMISEHVIHAAEAGKATPRSFFERLVGTFGAGRILWGSNFPASPGTPASLLALAQDTLAFLPENDRVAIFGGTAKRLYRFG
jgi:L-fuconolactonase